MDAVVEWIRRNIPVFLRPALNFLIHMITAAIDTITNPLRTVRRAWYNLQAMAAAARLGVRRFASEVYTTLAWVKGFLLPRALAEIYARARALAIDLVDQLRAFLLGRLDALRRWAQDVTTLALRRLDALRQWATGEVAKVWNLLLWTAKRVRDLLTSPDALAGWLAAAMLGALWRYVFDRRESVLRWLLRASPAVSVAVARELERTLERLI